MRDWVIKIALVWFLLADVFLLYPVKYYAEALPLNQFGYETLAVAVSLAHGHGFADPYSLLPTGPTAILPPAFPAFLAFLISVTSTESAAYFLMQCCATLMVVLQLCLLPLLARHMKLSYHAGLMAVIVWLLARVPRFVSWEQNYVGVLITILAFLMYSALCERLSWPRVIVCAGLWGVLLLACPVALPVLLVWVSLVCFAPRQSLAQKLVLVLLPVLVIAPWMVRNYSTFHQFVFIRDGLGFEMEVGNNSCASSSMEVNRLTSCYAQHHPNENREEASLVAEMGEVAYNKRKLRTAMEWIQENPGKFATLTVKRFVAFWTPSLLIKEQSPIKNQQLYWPPRDAIVSLASLASIAGLILLWKRNRNACIVFLLWLVLFPPVYYLCAYQERYRIPVVWAILIPACYAIRELGMKFTRQEGT